MKSTESERRTKVRSLNSIKAVLLFLLAAIGSTPVRAQPVDVLPVRTADGAQSLNGEWRFKYVPSSDVGKDETFFQPAFDVAAWKTIPVPGHWEPHGFAEPQYEDDVKEGTGLYRRTFRLPREWKGQRVFLRFDGVLYGLTAWVNGKPVGEWASSFNPVTFDVTDALAPGEAENVLAVRVTTRSKGWNFDNMDCWALSGIFRDVTLFALPPVHLKDYTARTTLKPDGTAEVHLDAVASAAAKVSGRLVAPDGKPVKEFELALAADGHGSTDLAVDRPQLWTAETPSLYRLELELRAGGTTVQRFADRIGLRQVTVEDGILKLNGTPIKLRGVDHHDIWPEEGRVATEERMRRDLELIRAANINFIRTSHYPPHPRFIEMCDEIGIYVDDEVPYVHGRKWLKDPSYQDVLLTRARATVMRDKNRPSVIFWTCGNENPVTELGNRTGRYVKQLDPTRPFTFPTIGSQFDGYLDKFPENMEIYAPHYPAVKKARQWAEKLRRPIVFTEYAHQRGLARAGTGVQDLWEVFYHSPRIAGGAVWLFQDQGILRTAADMKSVKDGDLMVWLDEHRYFDTHGFYAMDGIVYSDRTPQVDYWQVRKVYSPVQIAERSLAIKPGAQTLSIHVENRFDFRPLTGIRLKWALRRNGTSIQDGLITLGAKPKQTEVVPVPVTLPENLSTDVFTLELRCEDEQGRQFYERTIRLDPGAADVARWAALQASLSAADLGLEVSESAISVRHPSFQLQLDRRSGRLSLLDSGGVTIVSEVGPHTGRHPTINDMGKNRERESELWRWGLLHDLIDLKTDARQLPEGIEVSVSGNYPRPARPEESVRGGYKLLVTRAGAIDVSYDYAPVKATGEVLEAGFALAVPAAQSEFRWLGQGPYAGYPGKDRLNEYGLFHLNRDDLYFPGNRRGVELASLASPSGAGVLLAGSGMTVDLENVGATTILSHLALVPGERSNNEGKGENVDVSSRLKAGSVKNIAGKFTLLPLGGHWPKPLTNWFGSPGDRVGVTKPFLRSYDQ
jgi:beta-galactosidase